MNGNHGRMAELTCEVRSLARRVVEWEKKVEAIKEELSQQGDLLNRMLRSSEES